MAGKSLYGKTNYGLQPDGTLGFPKKPKLENFDDWLKRQPVQKASKPKKTPSTSANV